MTEGSEVNADQAGARVDRSEHPLLGLLRVMETLRGEGGCPWDRAQTHGTLLPYLVEEAHELIEAAESGDDAHLREELGDVLLQVVFHARIAEERGAFDMAGVAQGLTDKLRERHPHVFGGEALPSPEAAGSPASPEAVSQSWHARKMAGRDSAMEGVPAALPALQRARQVSERAARSGFEWNNRGEIFAKVAEELEEYRAECLADVRVAAPEADAVPGPEADVREGPASASAQPAAALVMEFGDLMFSMVQLARWQGVDPEAALRASTRKFERRFRWMEGALRERGEAPQHQDSDRWWRLWGDAKHHTD